MTWRANILKEAQKELKKIPNDLQASFNKLLNEAKLAGPIELGMPHVKHLREKLWELRFHAQSGIGRAIFCESPEKTIYIFEIFHKKSQKTEEHNLETALKRYHHLSEQGANEYPPANSEEYTPKEI